MRQKNIEEIPSFKPKVNEFNKPRPQDINAYLYYEGLSLGDRKQKAAEAIISQTCSFKPILNPNSLEIAANRKNRPETSNEVKPEDSEPAKPSRILKPKEFEDFLQRNYVKPLEKARIEEAENPTPSVTIVRVKKSNDGSLYEKGIKLKMVKEEKIRQAIENREKNELEGCTFKPRVLKRSVTPPPKSTRESSNASKKEGYSKNKGEPRELYLYKDKQGKKYDLKMITLVSSDFLKEFERLERRVLKTSM